MREGLREGGKGGRKRGGEGKNGNRGRGKRSKKIRDKTLYRRVIFDKGVGIWKKAGEPMESGGLKESLSFPSYRCERA